MSTSLEVRPKYRTNLIDRIVKYKAFYLMFLPVFLFFLIFHYIPLYGIRIAFYDYGLFGIKDFIGLQNFKELFASPVFGQVFLNTVILSGANLILGMVIPVIFALLLNEIRTGPFKKFTQTVVYLPHFLGWVVVASIFAMLLSPDSGVVNETLRKVGIKPIYFMISEKWWTPIFLMVQRWRETGWGAIIYLAALTGIDPQLYEAAAMDGAGKLRQVWNVTLPALASTIMVMMVLNISKIFDLFQPVFVMYNPQVYRIADVIDTYTYRLAFTNSFNISLGTAVGLFKSVIAMALVLITNKMSEKIKGESIL